MTRRGEPPLRERREVPPPDTERAVGERRRRAVEEPLDVRLRRRDVYPILEVRNPLHGTAYRVLLPEYPSASSALCTCTDFARRDLGTCKHIEASVRWLLEHPNPRPLHSRSRDAATLARLWREIDRQQSALGPPGDPESRAWRRAGRLLYEGRPDPLS